MRKCHHITTNQVAVFHGFYPFCDGEYSGPVAVVELPEGIVCWMAERTVFEDAPQETMEQNGHIAQQPQAKICGEIIESNDVCRYCVNNNGTGTTCHRAVLDVSCFMGRKLSAVQ